MLWVGLMAAGLSVQANFYVAPADSVGLEMVNGKTFIIHQVDPKETVYSLARRYNVTIYEIIDHNPGVDKGLSIGQRVRIPYIKAKTQASTPPPAAAADIRHVVEPGETLFALQRKYGVTVAEIKEWNKLTSDNLSAGQELVIKKSPALTLPAEPQRPQPQTTPQGETQRPIAQTPQSASPKIHTVEPGQGLLRVAQTYGVTMEEMRVWNKLATDNLSVGQRLYVSNPGANAPILSPAIAEVQEAQPERPMEQPRDTRLPVTVPAERPVTALPQPKVEPTSENFDEVVESGLAELIEGTDGNRKYLALHRTAKVGTIIRVRNEMNNQEIFVRVMGKLPDTGANDKVLIKLSKSAYDRLGAIDQRFRVRISYVP
jgi:LysM repeat protein